MSKAKDLAVYAGNANAAGEALGYAIDLIGRLYMSNPSTHGLRGFEGYPDIIRYMASELEKQSGMALTQLERMDSEDTDQ